MRASKILAAVAAVALLSGCTITGSGPGVAPLADLASTAAPGPQQDAASGQPQLWLLPSQQPGLLVRANLFRPPGAGPFPLAVIAHGSEQDPIARAHQPMPAFPALTAWLLARGYAVLLPQRPGHGDTGGPYLEDQGSCADADFFASGRATADSLAAAIGFIRQQAFVRPSGIVVIGNSAGGWGALALAAAPPPGVGLIVDFAGGRGGHDRGRAGQNCAPDRLVAAAGQFGRTARLPTLWLYAGNDSYFPPDLSRRMAAAFTAAGGNADYQLLPASGPEGHNLINQPATAWQAPLAAAFGKIPG